MRCTARLNSDARQVAKNAIYTAFICNFRFRFTQTFLSQKLLCTFLPQKYLFTLFCREHRVCVFFRQKAKKTILVPFAPLLSVCKPAMFGNLVQNGPFLGHPQSLTVDPRVKKGSSSCLLCVGRLWNPN